MNTRKYLLLSGRRYFQHRSSVRDATMAEFITCFLAQQYMNEPVVDRTGFGQTRLSFMLKFTPDPAMSAQHPATEADAPPDIFAAIEQQLGLHIQKGKTQVDVIVIDRVSKPSEN